MRKGQVRREMAVISLPTHHSHSQRLQPGQPHATVRAATYTVWGQSGSLIGSRLETVWGQSGSPVGSRLETVWGQSGFPVGSRLKTGR